MVIHFANIFLAVSFNGDPCTWYVLINPFHINQQNANLNAFVGILSAFYSIRQLDF